MLGGRKSAKQGRQASEALAALILSNVAQSGGIITDTDVISVLDLWKFTKNVRRVNVLPEGEQFVQSDMLGIVRIRAYSSVRISAASRAYPSVTKLLCRFVRDNPSPDLEGKLIDFPFATICVNKGYAARRHRDANNEGPCVCRALGSDIEGGCLRYWPSDTGSVKNVHELCLDDSVVIDHRNDFRCFHGSHAHEVLPYSGTCTRYSLVYFTALGHSRLPASDLACLHAKYGIISPTSVELRNASQVAESIWKPPVAYSDVPAPVILQDQDLRKVNQGAQRLLSKADSHAKAAKPARARTRKRSMVVKLALPAKSAKLLDTIGTPAFSERVRARPQGCSRCRYKPGCTPSCWHQTRTAKPARARKVVKLALPAKSAKLLDTTGTPAFSERVRARPKGCSRCKYKPGCTPSCWHQTRTAKPARARKVVKLTLPAKSAKLLDTIGTTAFSERVRARPQGCSRCRYKPGCAPSCWHKTRSGVSHVVAARSGASRDALHRVKNRKTKQESPNGCSKCRFKPGCTPSCRQGVRT